MNEMMSTGVEIMLVGMGTVFLFLAMLIVIVNVMSKVVQNFVSQDINEQPALVPNIDPSVVAAISTAVHHYRNKDES